MPILLAATVRVVRAVDGVLNLVIVGSVNVETVS